MVEGERKLRVFIDEVAIEAASMAVEEELIMDLGLFVCIRSIAGSEI